MSAPDHYRTMTDDQLAEWHQLTQRVQVLTRDLAESKLETQAVQNVMHQERRTWADEMNKRADLIVELTSQHQTQRDAARRSAAALVLALRALEALRAVVLEGKVSPDSIHWPGEVFRAVQDADEVIRAYGIPF